MCFAAGPVEPGAERRPPSFSALTVVSIHLGAVTEYLNLKGHADDVQCQFTCCAEAHTRFPHTFAPGGRSRGCSTWRLSMKRRTTNFRARLVLALSISTFVALSAPVPAAHAGGNYPVNLKQASKAPIDEGGSATQSSFIEGLVLFFSNLF